MSRWAAEEGMPFPLGMTWIEEAQAYNFALYSEHAECVTLLLFTDADLITPVFTYRFNFLKNKSGRIWHCRIGKDDLMGARYYAFTVAGPAETRYALECPCFDPEKILLDPYARSVFFPAAFDRKAATRPGSNAGKAPLGLLTSACETFDWGEDRRPHHESDTIIYELHVRGFTHHPNSGVRPEGRGTYSGIIEKIPYLHDLGVTAVELMPIFQYDPQEGNFWGYMPLNFFAPHHSYGSKQEFCDQHNDFRTMVKALHAADIEVILDVVYNHTAEGDERGPIYSFKGIDARSYYIMSNKLGALFQNFSGTGNVLNCSNRYVRKMIVDSLCYWVREMHVDGFRFDLASIFTRNKDGSLNLEEPPIFGDIVSHPGLADIRLIAEPWDAAGAYELGRNFPGKRWFQWNDRFRDDVRRFIRGDADLVPTLMQRLYGSDDLFPDDREHAFHPYQSVNFITAHDGFTLYDLVSYNTKRNWANGHNNTDGSDENYSWNCGWEGDEGVPTDVLKLRKQQVKNFFCLLLLANGTPMLRAGDEFLHTQGGNNNAYNQDNATSWLDWDRWRQHQDVYRFVRAVIRFRKAHPSLGRSRFWRDEVRWHGIGPKVDTGPGSSTLAIFLRGASQHDDDLYVMINAGQQDATFQIQEERVEDWQAVIDTSAESPGDFQEDGDRPYLNSATRLVRSRSTVVLIRKQ